jgi:hypothetical protein
MRLDDLEEALHESFDHDHLALYAEELRRQGDPRGEMIEIDLHSDRQIDTDETGELIGEMAERRRALRLELLGPVAAAHPLVRLRYGFVDLMFALRDDMRVGAVQAFDSVLLGPLGRFIRDVTLYGDGQRLRDLMVSLAQKPRPFLTRLSLESPHHLHYVDLPPEVAARAVEMLPRLERIEASGRRVIPSVEFPTVRQVVTHCYDAVVPLCKSNGGPPCFPLADAVNLRIAWTVAPAQLETMLPPRQLPMLRELDVSRCVEPVGDGAGYDVFRYIRGLEIAPQIERLRVPSVDRLEQAINLQAAIDRMPGLVELGIAGSYPLRAEPLRHKRASFRPIA